MILPLFVHRNHLTNHPNHTNTNIHNTADTTNSSAIHKDNDGNPKNHNNNLIPIEIPGLLEIFGRIALLNLQWYRY